MGNLKSRVGALEADAAYKRHIAYARASGDVASLTDSELDELITALDAEIGPEQAARIRGMSDAELAALAEGVV